METKQERNTNIQTTDNKMKKFTVNGNTITAKMEGQKVIFKLGDGKEYPMSFKKETDLKKFYRGINQHTAEQYYKIAEARGI